MVASFGELFSVLIAREQCVRMVLLVQQMEVEAVQILLHPGPRLRCESSGDLS